MTFGAFRNALVVCVTLALSACGGGDEEVGGIDTLGQDFVQAFSQDRNDAPLDPSGLILMLTPQIEPFDP